MQNMSKDCDECNGTGKSYWCDDVYGFCMNCCCFECEKVFHKCKCKNYKDNTPNTNTNKIFNISDYNNHNNIIKRNIKSNIVGEKNMLLIKCIEHFADIKFEELTNENVFDIIKISGEKEFNYEEVEENTRCCCSQDKLKKYRVIKINNCSFQIGQICFQNLLKLCSNIDDDNIIDLFKDRCNICDEIIKRRHSSRPNMCIECHKEQKIKEKEQQYKLKFYKYTCINDNCNEPSKSYFCDKCYTDKSFGKCIKCSKAKSFNTFLCCYNCNLKNKK